MFHTHGGVKEMSDGLASVTGQRLMFLGVGTQNWVAAQFDEAAQFAVSMGIDTVLLKVADWTNVWYGGIDGYHARKSHFTAMSVRVIPYTYSYGPSGGALDGEINILKTFMQDSGMVCMDAESEWNGQVDAARHLCEQMREVPGTFLVSTWADPQYQRWNDVLAMLAPVTDAFMPQIYSNNLVAYFDASQMTRYPNIPTYSLTTDQPGMANDPVAAAAHYSAMYPIFSLWHYGTCRANPELTKQIIAAVPRIEVHPVKPPPYDGFVKQALLDQWNSSTATPHPNDGTGIYKAWVTLRLVHGYNAGPPTNNEYDTVNWDGKKIVAQECGSFRFEWDEGQPRCFGPAGEVKLGPLYI